MAWGGEIPIKGQPKYRMQCSDDFDCDELDLQWQWNHQPRKEMYSLTERKGWLRLKAFRPVENDRLLKAGNTLTQRTFRVPHNRVDIRMDLSRMAEGQKAGLCHFSFTHAAAGVVCDGGKLYVEYRKDDRVERGEELPSSFIWLRSVWGVDGKVSFYYSSNGDEFHPIGEDYQMMYGGFRGGRIGIYNFNNLKDDGIVDVDYLHYEKSPFYIH